MFRLYANCIITNGISRSIICDTQNRRFYLVPNSMTSLFDKRSIINFTKLIQTASIEEQEILIEYKDFLIQNNLIFPIGKSEIDLFPNIPLAFHFSSHISNALIDIKNRTIEWNDLATELDNLNCLHIQLRFYEKIEKNEIIDILNTFSKTLINSIDIILRYNENIYNDISAFDSLIKMYPKIRTITLFGADKNEIIINPENGLGGIRTTNENITNELACGLVTSDMFTINTLHYTESLAHNTCLNRKIAIDAEGNIKNCPSMKESFGNIRDTTLEEAINKPGFKKYWNIIKDEITKCKDCEFRHVCTDCRAYIDNPDDIYSAPLKCGYDPYTCTWEEWSSNPLKQKAIDYYGMREILTSENEV